MHEPTSIHGLLIDLDGVCHVDGAVVPGAPEALRTLSEAGVPVRFITNTTTRSRRGLHQRLTAMGLPISEDTVFSAPRAAARFLREHGGLRARLVVADAVREDFAGVELDETAPQAVVIGDIGTGWSYELLDGIFRQVLAGARLVALHKGRYWQTAQGLSLDIGAFVAGLEYATRQEALVIGKPAPAFFLQAIADLGLPAGDLAVVGDDIDSDIGGGQACGLTGIQVRTGKWRADLAAASPVRPHFTCDSLADVPGLLGLD
jgi:HAD superfamily hydrolase (TIGR01458 family)